MTKRNYREFSQRMDMASTFLMRMDRMQIVVDVLWDGLHKRGVSWVGFYLDRPQESDESRLILGPHRDKPACSPIGLNGVCGKALVNKHSVIVDDVTLLGESYIPCDPRDRSEIVIPLLEENGNCWGVLDLDSWDVASFDKTDDAGLKSILRTAKLTAPS